MEQRLQGCGKKQLPMLPGFWAPHPAFPSDGTANGCALRKIPSPSAHRQIFLAAAVGAQARPSDLSGGVACNFPKGMNHQ